MDMHYDRSNAFKGEQLMEPKKPSFFSKLFGKKNKDAQPGVTGTTPPASPTPPTDTPQPPQTPPTPPQPPATPPAA